MEISGCSGKFKTFREPEDWKEPIAPSSRLRLTKLVVPPRMRQVLCGETESLLSIIAGLLSTVRGSGKAFQSLRNWAKEASTSFMEEMRTW